ncbi:MAG: protein BatD [Thiomicrospira sp.]|uniref:BatD family protein n=1 Tax=Thiomicrospira sp. TaxID=935 RepID=UPI0019E045BF|nr:BatD family protein [Thiomicrospira sp.]MBE0494531.1 protein BatD [Thiomicrospira sp.]
MVNNKQVRPLFFLFLALSLLPGLALANKTLQASVDRNLVELGDIIQLNINGNFQTTHRPDLERLKNDFEVLGSQASNQLQIVHGQFSAVTNWDVQILPKRTGELRIPAFEVDGLQTQPIQIQVAAASQKQTDYQVSYLEAQVDNANPYVQSEVIFTLRYYHLGSLVRGNIDAPQFDGFMVERLQNQRSFERQVAGRNYRVYEWVYALYPQTSGEITIPPQSFDGTLLHQRELRQVKQKSETIQLKVKPIPPEFPPNANWLPAKKIELKDEWTQPNNLKTGETLGRRITLQAQGLKASQLPNLDWQETEEYRLYNDPVSQNDRIESGGLSSHKMQDFMMVMHNPGQIIFETIEIPWWNTQTDQLEIARLDQRVFDVQSNPLLEQALNLTNPALEPPTVQPHSSSTLWPLISALLAIFWLITLVLLFKRHTNTTPAAEKSTPTNDHIMVQLDEASIAQLSQLSDAQLDLALKHWLKIHYQIQDWNDLKHKQPKLFTLMQALQLQLYHPQALKASFDRQALLHELNGLSTHQHHQTTSPLAELYPDQKNNNG